jgi:hypothetical protein
MDLGLRKKNRKEESERIDIEGRTKKKIKKRREN